MNRTSITSSVTDGQKDHYETVILDAARRGVTLAQEKVSVDRDGWQRILEHGNELRTAIAEVIVAKTRELSMSDRFSNDECDSNCVYYPYRPKDIVTQTRILHQFFPGIGYANEKLIDQPLPENAEGRFILPRWEKFAPTYGEAVQIILDMLHRTYKFNFLNDLDGQLGPECLRQSERTIKAFQILDEQQKDSDILVIPAQFGFFHRGRSVRRVRAVMDANEFGLGVFATGVMLLTHPERFEEHNYVLPTIDCPGDEFSHNSEDDGFDCAPCFSFNIKDKVIQFIARRTHNSSDNSGPASGFIPQ